MPKKVILQPHLPPEELKEQYLSRGDRVEARRYHLRGLIVTDWNIKEAAKIVGFSYNYALDLVRNYNANGVDAITNLRHQKKPLGRSSLLTNEQYLTLQTLLQQPPPEGGEWTGAAIG